LKLPFFDRSFDVVVCQFGAMFFPDKVAAYREALRVLRPGGFFVLAVWDRIEENEFAAVVTDAVAALFPGDPPGFLQRTPHGYHDAVLIRGELEAAGFAGIAVDTVARRSQAPGCRDPAIGYVQGTPLRSEIEAWDASRLGDATDVAAAALGARFGFGPVDGKMQAYVITASL
jgi:SAM-dependent methyltransferase